MNESSFSMSNVLSSPLVNGPLLRDGSHNVMPPARNLGLSTQAQPKLGPQRERLWTTVLFVTIASIPALLVGCTLAFPSIALLDLSELEKRPDYRLSTVLSDVFGVRSVYSNNYCANIQSALYTGVLLLVICC